MKLVVAIVAEDQAGTILSNLSAADCRATLISSTGGFLRKGNSTLLVGVDASQVDRVLKHIAAGSATIPRAKGEQTDATVFVLNVEHVRQM